METTIVNFEEQEQRMAKMLTAKTLNEIFAINIQPVQLRTMLPHCRWADPNAIEEERKSFLSWLNEMGSEGYSFTNQVDAWTAYCMYFDFAVEEYETETTSWMDDIEQAYVDKVNTWANLRNYEQVGRRNNYAQQ